MATAEPEREAEGVADATATIGTDRYHVDLEAGRHVLAADEPADHGGADTGPPPFGLLLSGLGACTAITLRMYADRKQWPLEGVDVQLAYTVKDRATRWIDRQVTLRGPWRTTSGPGWPRSPRRRRSPGRCEPAPRSAPPWSGPDRRTALAGLSTRTEASRWWKR